MLNSHLELLGSSDPPTLASQNGRIRGVSHCAKPNYLICVLFAKLHEGRGNVYYVHLCILSAENSTWYTAGAPKYF